MLLQKLRILVRRLFKILLCPVAFPVVLIIRLIRPLFLVRFGVLFSERIGHFAGNTELYLCERDVGINVPSKPYIDLWYHNGIVCNKQLALMWQRELSIWPGILLSLLDRLNGLLPGHEAYRIGTNSQMERDVHNLLDRFPPHLRFLPNEEKLGSDGLEALIIPEGAPFVCLNVRDAAYLDKMYPARNWRSHDYRDSNISNYIPVAQKLAKKGYYVIRMGAVVKEPLPVSHPMIIDYATSSMRNDLMDIYLSAKCEFFISTGTGLDNIPYIFRRPIIYVNFVPLSYVVTYTSKSIAIFKKHWIRSEKRLMTFREIFESGSGHFFESQQFENMGIELIENSPEEIADVVLEMEARLKGTWETTEEDEELQKRFWDIFPKNSVSPYNNQSLHGEIRSRIGAEFLKQNRALLE